MEPLNNGHSGDRPLVHCREVVPISEVSECMHGTMSWEQAVRPFYGGCLLLRVSTIGGSTVQDHDNSNDGYDNDDTAQHLSCDHSHRLHGEHLCPHTGLWRTG